MRERLGLLQIERWGERYLRWNIGRRLKKTLGDRNNEKFRYVDFIRWVSKSSLLTEENKRNYLIHKMIEAYPKVLDNLPVSAYSLAWLSNAISTLRSELTGDMLKIIRKQGYHVGPAKVNGMFPLNPFSLWSYPYNCRKSEVKM